jgi:hypothetical protein
MPEQQDCRQHEGQQQARTASVSDREGFASSLMTLT